MATATLTEDERLAVAAMGGWIIADALSGYDESLWDSHACGTLDDLVLMVRPSWRGKMYDIEKGSLWIGLRSTEPPAVQVTRRRLAAFAETLPDDVREQLRANRLRRTYPETTRLIWWALDLGRPPAERRPPMNSYRRTPAGPCDIPWRNALGSPATAATVATVTTDRAPETVSAADRVAALRESWASGQPLTGGQLFGLPALDGDVWADIAGATVITGLPAKTITSYLARDKPKFNPFPKPSQFLGRNYWPASVLLEWAAGQSKS
ncbi:hypothetical protein ACWFPY_36785 [Nocardia fluminea]